MILGIGTDMARIERVADVLSRHDDRFVARCFAVEEQEHIERKKGKDAHRRAAGYAKYWAAKEACAKALGTGVRDDIFLKDMVVVQDAAGKPEMILRGGARARLESMTPQGLVPRVHVSLSDEPPMALAFVIISAEVVS